MQASDLLVRALENEGVEYIFGVPGEENLDLMESLRQSRQIRFILTRHEQGAGFMAATYGRLTGKTGVCLSTLGPGATNLVTAAAYAQLGAMPFLMITGQKPIKKSKQGRFQIIDVVDMMEPLTKFSRPIIHANTIPSLVREAFRLAQEERPGAVHLELPEDVAQETTDREVFALHTVERPAADPAAISQATALIQQARRPLLLIGAAANRHRTAAVLRRFVDKIGIPFFNTQMGKGVIDEDHPLFLGTAAMSEKDYIHCAIGQADLIINVGHDIIEKPPFLMKPDGFQVIHVNFFSAQVDDVYFPQLEVIGDIAGAVQLLMEAVVPQSHWDFGFFLKTRAAIETHIREGSQDARFPTQPARLVADIQQAMPRDGLVALDNGIYKIWFARNYKAHFPHALLLDNALASMGAGLPSAIAASLLQPQRPTLAICGDGGFMMTLQELETAVRLGVSLTVLILNDGAFGMIKWKQEHMGLADFGLDFNNPDFVALAESFGARGHRITRDGELQPLLQACFTAGGIHLIDLPVDYSGNRQHLLTDLGEQVCRFESLAD